MIRRMKKTMTIEKIKNALLGPLPGRSAQLKMSTRPRPGDTPPFDESAFREGAVLILLYPSEGELYLPLTKRTSSVELHKGHISLPGGAREADESLVETALRETGEEIGVNVPEKSVLGALSIIHIPVSRYRVAPFVAALKNRPDYHPDTGEVEEIIETPLQLILDEKRVCREWQVHLNRRMLVPYYRLGKHRIWGATAMILSEFAELLSKNVE